MTTACLAEGRAARERLLIDRSAPAATRRPCPLIFHHGPLKARPRSHVAPGPARDHGPQPEASLRRQSAGGSDPGPTRPGAAGGDDSPRAVSSGRRLSPDGAEWRVGRLCWRCRMVGLSGARRRAYPAARATVSWHAIVLTTPAVLSDCGGMGGPAGS